jgi:hypothetical protein
MAIVGGRWAGSYYDERFGYGIPYDAIRLNRQLRNERG